MHPILNERGTVVSVAVLAIDRTEQKRAEEALQKAHDELERRVEERTAELQNTVEALRASEERFRVTFEEAPVGMIIGVGDGVIAKANRALCYMSGYTEEELIGQHVRDLAPPEDRELSDPSVKRLLAGEIPSFTIEKRYLRKDGQSFWAQATTASAHGPDGKIAFALGVVEDITKRKEVQEALRQSHDQLQTVYDGMVEGLVITDIETKR